MAVDGLIYISSTTSHHSDLASLRPQLPAYVALRASFPALEYPGMRRCRMPSLCHKQCPNPICTRYAEAQPALPPYSDVPLMHEDVHQKDNYSRTSNGRSVQATNRRYLDQIITSVGARSVLGHTSSSRCYLWEISGGLFKGHEQTLPYHCCYHYHRSAYCGYS